ncbi:MAG: outer membrane protein assembly factor BamD [Bdellovibrio sp. CG10_big_fil_rev_8_21_14_0_10_47_8]|nr:MAG: outer membrane protein assembly factor BamD [Bdellovibrio sp. CG10_big_fil_rev_8_21_14_0_10_47_8]
MLRVIFSVLLLFSTISATTVLLTSCSSNDKKSDTAEGAFAIAQDYDKEERYEEAIKRYQEVKNKFPYSKYASMAELALADCYYKQESYAEAQVAYQSFKDLHPKHAQIDYVTYRLAMSFFNQLPSTVDRDLTLASSALIYFDEVLTQYPNSEYVKDAKEKKVATLKMLAGKEDYIAEFYFIREKYDSALNRYEELMKKYPGYGFDAKALSRAAVCAAKLGEPGKAKKLVNELEKRFPGSDELAFAKKGADLGD